MTRTCEVETHKPRQEPRRRREQRYKGLGSGIDPVIETADDQARSSKRYNANACRRDKYLRGGKRIYHGDYWKSGGNWKFD